MKQLISRIAAGNYTSDELAQFLKELNELKDPSYLQAFNELYQQVIQQPPVAVSPDFMSTMERKLNELDARMHEENDLKVQSIGTPWLKYAVAAALVLSLAAGGIMLFNRKANTPPTVIAKADKAPGKDHAVLTLADGRQVILDSRANGVVSTQGGTTVINLKGKLTYSNEGTPEPGKILYNTIETRRGNQYQLILPDGSKVWLNAASSLRYATSFNNTERKVELTGEAYFDIAKDDEKPFTVSFNQAEVKVLGTEFNVMAYADEPNGDQATLVNGSVIVTSRQQKVPLHPGKMAVINNGIKLRTADIEQVTAWKNGEIALDNTDLASLMRQISRWYDVDISFEGAIPTQRFVGVVKRSVYLSTLLDFLKENRINNRMERGKILLYPY